MGGLRIVTYNCRGIKSSLPVIHELCTDNDIFLLQGTVLCSHNIHLINSLHSEFYAGGCISVDSSERVIMVALLLNSSHFQPYTIIPPYTIIKFWSFSTLYYSDLYYYLECESSAFMQHNYMCILNHVIMRTCTRAPYTWADF